MQALLFVLFGTSCLLLFVAVLCTRLADPVFGGIHLLVKMCYRIMPPDVVLEIQTQALVLGR